MPCRRNGDCTGQPCEETTFFVDQHPLHAIGCLVGFFLRLLAPESVSIMLRLDAERPTRFCDGVLRGTSCIPAPVVNGRNAIRCLACAASGAQGFTASPFRRHRHPDSTPASSTFCLSFGAR